MEATFADAIDYIWKVKDASDKEFQSYYRATWGAGKQPHFEITFGPKYFKVVMHSESQKSVFCFIERATGDLYKAATWNTPAKGIRGNIRNEKVPLTLGEFYINSTFQHERVHR